MCSDNKDGPEKSNSTKLISKTLESFKPLNYLQFSDFCFLPYLDVDVFTMWDKGMRCNEE